MSWISLIVVACLCVTPSTAHSLAHQKTANVPQNQQGQNEQFDRFVRSVRSYILSRNLSDIALGNIADKQIKATNGVLKNMSTLSRANDAKLTPDSGGVNVKGSLTFKDFEIDFNFIQFHIGELDVGDCGASFKVDTNQIDVDFDYRPVGNNQCDVKVNRVALTKLDGLKIHFSDPSLSNWIFDRLAPVMLDLTSKTIVASINDRPLVEMTEAVLKSVNLCKL